MPDAALAGQSDGRAGADGGSPDSPAEAMFTISDVFSLNKNRSSAVVADLGKTRYSVRCSPGRFCF